MNLRNYTDQEQNRLSWIRERYDGLLEMSWGKEHKEIYMNWKQEMLKLDRERTEIYLTKNNKR